jgi:ABC-2 type transport system permease protein
LSTPRTRATSTAALLQPTILRAPRTTAFRALSLAILRGFVRDRTSVFFAVVFPLMFLVLFGGLFSDQSQGKVDMLVVGDVSLVDDLPEDARTAFGETFDVTASDDLDAAIDEVRKGDADVALEQQRDILIARYTRTDPAKAAITQGALRSFVDGTNLALTGQPPTHTLEVEQVEDDSLDAIQYYTPGLLGWAVAMSAAFGAAATLQGWRQSKLLRRLQLAPVSTRTVVGARVSVTAAIALVQMSVFLGIGTLFFDLTLTGAWWMSIPLLVVGTLCFMAIGLLAGAITKTQEGAVNAANFLVLPMAFLSGSFFPLEGSPGWLQAFSDVLPLKHLNHGMLDVMVRGEPWTAALVPMAVLAGFAVVVTLVAARMFRWETM